MAETSLRAYVREIDDFIEHDQLDEAIAHARHILQTYPRHLETYRLLGKAYLEAKRYGDSADILQRVLSAVPDDFVAHVGMSIVREDEGNLDSSIWHMERAFETTPSNAAVQGELRRLIGKRDGLEPAKVRLTRGALARMYAHGELYPQAIAELRSALSEDPDRPDLQVLLADMYWRTNQRGDAAEVATALLETLPNCREANRIMAAALHSEGRTEEALTYHRRVAALDPYSALVETILDDPTRVDANAVRIEKISWQPGQPLGRDTGPAEWASGATQARAPAGQPATPRPSWLESMGAATAAKAAAAERKPEASVSPPPAASEPAGEEEPKGVSGQIPEWMEEAGWTPGTGQAREEPVSFSDDELRSLELGALPPEPAPEAEGDLVRANIPDWLSEVAPPAGPVDEPEPAPDPVSAAAGFSPSGLEAPRLPPGWSPPPGGAEEDDDWLKAAGEDAQPIPTWMEEDAPGATATIVTWLGDRQKSSDAPPAPSEAKAPPGEPVAEEAALARAEIPEWLAADTTFPDSIDEGEAAAAPPSGPGWLSGVAEAAARGSSIDPKDMSWQSEVEGPITTGMYPEEAASEDEAEAVPADLPDWLQTIAATGSTTRARDRTSDPAGPSQPAPAEPQAGQPRIGDSGSFDWLRELAESEPPTPASPEAPGEERAAPSWMASPTTEGSSRSVLGQSAGPEWLRGIAEPGDDSGGEIDAGPVDWLRGIAEPSAEETVEAPAPPEPGIAPSESDTAAEWVNLLAGTEATGTSDTGEWLQLLKRDGVPEPEAEATSEAPEVPSGEMSDDQVFDWLETLAAKQGIPAPQPMEQAPPVPTKEPIRPIPPVVAGTPATPAPPLPARLPPEEPEAGLEWLEGLAAEQRAVPDVPGEPIAQSVEFSCTPDRTAGTGATPEPTLSAPAPAAAPAPGPTVPDWLKQLVSEPRTETPSTEAKVDPETETPAPPTAETWPSLPSWMTSAGPGEAEEEPTVPALPIGEPVLAKTETAPEPEPIDELADTWVPPWESLEIEESEPSAPEPAAETIVSSPLDETVISRPALPIEATEEILHELEAPGHTPEVERTLAEPPSGPRYREPTTDVLEEVPEWLRTPAPRRPATTELVGAPIPVEEEDSEVPDWLTPPAAAPTPVQVPTAPAVVSKPAGTLDTAPPPEPAVVPPPPRIEAPPVREPAMVTEPPTPAVIEPDPVMEPASVKPMPEPPEIEAEAVREPAPVSEPTPLPPHLPPAVTRPKPPVRAPQPAGVKPVLEDRLREARKGLATGDYRSAAGDYGAAVKKKYQLSEVIAELEHALERNPKAAPLWQVLGDAYMKADRLPEAITAYERGVAAV